MEELALETLEAPPHASVAWYSWARTSHDMLEYFERQMLRMLKVPHEISQVRIDDMHHINTLETFGEHDVNKTPIVLVHGFGGGLGLFIKNIEPIAAHRKVFAIDVIGFGRSSRPFFDKGNSEKAETDLVEALEKWRKVQNIEKFVLLGHSFGGYQVGAYALKYPERVSHVIFADPWGFPERPSETTVRGRPLWLRTAVTLLEGVSPFSIMRGLGPFGAGLIPRFRPDLLRKFESHVSDSAIVASYIYHLNAQRPSGENAFIAMSHMFGWAKMPFITRVAAIDPKVPMTFLYGSHTWMDRSMGDAAREIRKDSHVDVRIVSRSGHHLYADNADEFNTYVIEALKNAT